METPLRAVVLDNDEATGFYHLLFDLWDVLNKTSLGHKLTVGNVLEFLVENYTKYHIFRPSLFKFLRTCIALRNAGRIDAIIMYTHQNAGFTWRKWSIPAFLAVLMGKIVGTDDLFDHVLTLPPVQHQKVVNGWAVKDFDRILNLYPWKPRDIRQIIFVDDNASPKHIEADTIHENLKHTNSWYKVEHYRVQHTEKEYLNFVNDLVRYYGISLTESDWLRIKEKVPIRRTEVENMRVEDRTFLDLDGYVRERFAQTGGGRRSSWWKKLRRPAIY